MNSATLSPQKRRKKSGFNSKPIIPYLYILPTFAFLIVFLLVPLITALVKSFYNYNALNLNEFIGLKNYIRLFSQDTVFFRSLYNMFILWLGMNVCFAMPIIAAKLLNMVKSERIQYGLRTIFMLPIVVPSVVTMMLWKFIYYPQIGVLAKIASILGTTAPNLLGNPSTALIAVILVGFPWISGMNFIIAYSALRDVDISLLEAARLDGASEFKIFTTVELPVIMPQIKALYILCLIGQIHSYENMLILTQGGPQNATVVPGLHMYNIAFSQTGSSEYGYACAIAVVLFITTLVLSKILMGGKKE